MERKCLYRLYLTTENGNIFKMNILGENVSDVLVKVDDWAKRNNVIITSVHLKDEYGVCDYMFVKENVDEY